ncbi:hypothetical protein M758_5G133500 [Ceratodon purpureus]|uniref:RRM domain-containing protein n=1 Tax=Ceratodon purpureus TaxID=3225 RepID=A0A8T0I342_CERPU|nr:hypothetical protein KC19_5G139400 [Ceratodon purpureus]KAG0616675.1 hypothetical protein M758_5G133500 [Ceratodon purpureus]
MTSALDMSLDDLIKTNKSATRGGRGGGRGAGGAPRRGGASGGGDGDYPMSKAAGPARRQVSRATARPTPYASAKPARRAPESAWQHDMYNGGGFAPAAAAGGRAMSGGGIETGTKLYISNLDYGVSNDDIKELFSEVGDLKRCSINYDRSGRSKGTAEVVFTRKPDAVAAVKRYNNVQLDGKPMKIEMIGTNLNSGPVPAARTNGAMTIMAGRGRTVSSQALPFARGPGSDRGRGGSVAFRGRGGGRSANGGRGGGGRGGGRGAPKEEKSVEDLDADLESYHAQAMETN